jgi:hypothetical protein
MYFYTFVLTIDFSGGCYHKSKLKVRQDMCVDIEGWSIGGLFSFSLLNSFLTHCRTLHCSVMSAFKLVRRFLHLVLVVIFIYTVWISLERLQEGKISSAQGRDSNCF